MMPRSGSIAPPRARSAWLLLPLVAGLLMLLLRRYAVGTEAAATLFVAIVVLLAMISIAAPMRPVVTTPRLSEPLVIAIGVAAVASTLLLGPGIPLPQTSMAIFLNAGAAVAEELFFRRFLYGSLERLGPVVAIAVSASLFALVHVPLYGVSVVWVDLGAGLLFSWQRWASGSWRAPAATHVVANILAGIR
jgi:membrane protease YdiL (CAAX protease family)